MVRETPAAEVNTGPPVVEEAVAPSLRPRSARDAALTPVDGRPLRRRPRTAREAATAPVTPAESRARQAEARRNPTPAGAYGDPPPSPFGGLPISEVAIFAGLVGVIVGIIEGGGPALVVGIIVCALGVMEVTGREHMSGYRAHTVMLAGVPAAALGAGLVAVFGEPQLRVLLLLPVVPVYVVLFWFLRKRFVRARQARMARPPAP